MKTLRLRVVASKEDNPWLPEDVVSRPGGCIKVSPGYTLADVAPDMPEQDAKNGARAIVKLLRREGLL